MKSFVVFALVLATALAAPQLTKDGEAQIVRYESDNIGTSDGYSYAYETGNGIKAQEQGGLANVGTDDEALEVSGSFSYYGPDNILYEVQYTAGKEGFQAKGVHIPQLP